MGDKWLVRKLCNQVFGLDIPSVSTGSSLVKRLGDGDASQIVFVVVSLKEFVAYLTNVSGDNHKISQRKSYHDIPIPIPDFR